jgi:hypothetical protein
VKEIPVAVDAIVLQDGDNKAFRSYVACNEGQLYFIGIPERPLPDELVEGLTCVTDVLVLDINREYNISLN